MKAKITIYSYATIAGATKHYCGITFEDRALETKSLFTENYKTKIGALNAAKRFCKKFNIQYEVVK